MAAGSLSLVITAIRTAISNSSTFQTETGTASAAAALAYIHLYLESEADILNQKRPMAVLRYPVHGYHQYASGPSMQAAGTVRVLLFANAKNPADEDQSYIDFLDFAGQVIDELVAAGSLDATFAELDMPMAQEPLRTPRDQRSDKNDFWMAAWDINYGIPE